jgi:hypothetical protein
MDYKLWNWLGMGSKPRLHLELGDSVPKWDTFNIDYGQEGGMPSEWSAWNVKDEQKNNYGTITVARDGSNWSVRNYVKGDGSLEGITLPPGQGTGSYQLKCTAIHPPNAAPPIITNQGWSNGQGNSDSSPIVGESFWVQDYGMDEPGRWTAEGGAIYQSTARIRGNNVGSRAYPIKIGTGAPDLAFSGGVGVACEGLWQIDIRIGSNGRSSNNFCETFYLAKRADLTPGPSHYTDGNPGTPPNTTEIDIMETKWRDGCPNINLPNGSNTGWNPKPDYGITMPPWTDVGGAPTADFITFGCLIRGNDLWLYAYKPVPQTQWYCTKKVPKNNSNYDNKTPFVPYIGTWSAGNEPGGFKTGYKNFIYLPKDDPKIKDKNPHDHPEAFGPALIDTTAVLYVVNYDTSATARKYVVTDVDSKPPHRPPLEIGPSSFVRVSAEQVYGGLPWYIADNPTGRPPVTKVEKLPAVLSFDTIDGVKCLTAVAYAAAKPTIEMNDILYVVDYCAEPLQRFVGGKAVKLAMGPKTFVSVTAQQPGIGSLPWYVAWSPGQQGGAKVEQLPAVVSLAPRIGVPSPGLTAVAYRAK